MTVTDPATGQPVQQLMQTKIDPKTGKATQVVCPLPSANNVITIQDPVTGQLKQVQGQGSRFLLFLSLLIAFQAENY